MSAIRFAASDGLPALLARLSQDSRILVPVAKPAGKHSVVFESWREGMPVILEKAAVPPKNAVLPQCEPLLVYKKSKNPDRPEDVALRLDGTPQAHRTLIFACRPCDARGFAVLDRPFLRGPFADPYYKAKREHLAVVTITCSSGCNTCFCHWVGGGPSSPEGSDVLMTEIDDGFVLQAVTSTGESLLASSGLADGKEAFA
ncbi:MAG: hydrogenase, partial [Desulfovibrio sp.]|nr:hydrogenase [Desulfovibrio sp.]